jgi:hypothetical protein
MCYIFKILGFIIFIWVLKRGGPPRKFIHKDALKEHSNFSLLFVCFSLLQLLLGKEGWCGFRNFMSQYLIRKWERSCVKCRLSTLKWMADYISVTLDIHFTHLKLFEVWYGSVKLYVYSRMHFLKEYELWLSYIKWD